MWWQPAFDHMDYCTRQCIHINYNSKVSWVTMGVLVNHFKLVMLVYLSLCTYKVFPWFRMPPQQIYVLFYVEYHNILSKSHLKLWCNDYNTHIEFEMDNCNCQFQFAFLDSKVWHTRSSNNATDVKLTSRQILVDL